MKKPNAMATHCWHSCSPLSPSCKGLEKTWETSFPSATRGRCWNGTCIPRHLPPLPMKSTSACRWVATIIMYVLATHERVPWKSVAPHTSYVLLHFVLVVHVVVLDAEPR